MNILDYIIIAILAFGMLAGMRKGMITSALSLVGIVGAWFGAQAIYPQITNLALGNPTLMAVLNQYLEPDSFFDTQAQAMTSVTQLVQQGEGAISEIVNKIGGKFGFLADAYSTNLRTLAFKNLGINTVSEYFDQTFWQAIFNVTGFVIAFILLYLVINLFVNLLDHVVAFPLLKRCDWLLGGVFGLVRSVIVVLLVLNTLPAVAESLAPELAAGLLTGSKLYAFMRGIDWLGVGKWIASLVLNK